MFQEFFMGFIFREGKKLGSQKFHDFYCFWRKKQGIEKSFLLKNFAYSKEFFLLLKKKAF